MAFAKPHIYKQSKHTCLEIMCLARTAYNGYQRPAAPSEAPHRAAAAQLQRSVVLQQHDSASSHDGPEMRKTTVCLVANNSLKTEKTTVGTIR